MDRARLLALTVGLVLLPSAAALAAGPAQTQVAQGFHLFMSVGCYECHGTVGQGGGAAGPRLAPDPLPEARILAIVRKPLKTMPPYNERVLSDADVTAIHAYLASIKPPPPLDSLPQFREGPK